MTSLKGKSSGIISDEVTTFPPRYREEHTMTSCWPGRSLMRAPNKSPCRFSTAFITRSTTPRRLEHVWHDFCVVCRAAPRIVDWTPISSELLPLGGCGLSLAILGWRDDSLSRRFIWSLWFPWKSKSMHQSTRFIKAGKSFSNVPSNRRGRAPETGIGPGRFIVTGSSSVYTTRWRLNSFGGES